MNITGLFVVVFLSEEITLYHAFATTTAGNVF